MLCFCPTHSYTFYLLRTALNKRRAALLTQLQNYAALISAARRTLAVAPTAMSTTDDDGDAVVPKNELDDSSNKCDSIDATTTIATIVPTSLSAIIELLLNLTEQTAMRSLTLSVNDLAAIISWTSSAAAESETDKLHPLLAFNAVYEQNVMFSELLRKLSEASSFAEMTDVSEPSFAQADGIVQQFAARPVFVLVDDYMEVEHANYWTADTGGDGERIEVDDDDDDNDNEENAAAATTPRILCDLTELIKTCLPTDVNVSGECKRLLHLSASPQSNRERTTTAPCFRTRRVEVEPATGRPEKKIYGNVYYIFAVTAIFFFLI